MENYIVIKKLPDAEVGVKVNWCETKKCFKYKKSEYIPPNDTTYLTFEQVTQNIDYFCKAKEFPDYYAYEYPTYSRKEIDILIEECFPNKRLSGQFEISASTQLQRFCHRLREIGKINAEKIIRRTLK